MKKHIRMFALLTALLMILPLSACMTPGDEKPVDESAAPATEVADAPVEPGAFDRDAIAVELGSVKITAGEIKDSYDFYLSFLQQYGGSAPTEEAQITEYREMAVNDLINYNVPFWKAEELGVSLTEAEEQAITADVTEQVDEQRASLISQYAYYAGAVEAAPDDISELTDEQQQAALDLIGQELAEYYYEGYTLDQYLLEQYENMEKDARASKLEEKLRAQNDETVSIGQDAIDSWYSAKLAEQKTAFDETPSKYRDARDEYLAGESTDPALYVPEGFVRVQLVTVVPEEERDLKIETNKSEMSSLEKEYGQLALNNENAARQAEIRTKYAELRQENDKLEEAFLSAARQKINEAYGQLEEDVPFSDVMRAFNDHEEGEDGADELLLYVGGTDEVYGELSDVAKELLDGTYSEPVLIDDAYYIVMRVGNVTPGEIDRAENADLIREAAAASVRENAWNALLDEWKTEASRVAIRHPETYASVGLSD